MTRLERIADLLMAAAKCLAPPSRREWIAAMRGEAAALEQPAQALRWAAGALAAAVGWRLAYELPALLGLAALCTVLPMLQMLAFSGLALLHRGGDLDTSTFMLVERLAHGLLAGAALFVFALYRLRLAVAAAIILPLWSSGSFFWPVVVAALQRPMGDVGNEPALANWLFAPAVAWMLVWPGLAGVAAALALKVVLRRRRAAPTTGSAT